MNARQSIIERLERYVYDDAAIGRQCFFDALADAAVWNRKHPDETIPKMVGGKVPVPCEACGGRCDTCGRPDFCCVSCVRICRS